MTKTISFALALLGLFISIYLLTVYVSPSHPMVCLGGTGCDEVRASRYSHFGGIPTPVFGVIFYVLLAALIFLETKAERGGAIREAVLVLAGIGVAVSAALTYVEAAVIHAWCAWCVAQAIVAFLIFLLAAAGLRREYRNHNVRRAAASRFTTVFLVAFVAGCIAFYLLQRAEATLPPPPPAAEAIASKLIRPDSHVTGNAQSTVTFVEFGDIQCPACAASFPVVEDLRRQYGDRVKFVFRHYPLPTIHQFAMKAAVATECAAQQGRFWPYLDRVYAANGDLGNESLERYAKEVGIDAAGFHQCLSTDVTLAQVQRDQADGLALGVRATPTFFVGKRRIEGPLTAYQFSQMILEDLQSAGTLNPTAVPASPPPAASPPAEEPAKEQPAKQAGAKSSPALSMGGGSAGGGFFDVKGASTDCSEDAAKGPEPPLIRTPDAQERLEQGARFVDVRPAADFVRGHIKGATHLPLLEVESRAAELPKDKPIVVYEAGTAAGDVCAAAKSAARVLISRGYRAVVYQDGLKDWEKSGLAVEK